MGLFRPYQRDEEPVPSVATQAHQTGPEGKKDAPTPTRKEAEAARRERLHPTLSPKEQRSRDREARNEAREAQFRSVDAQPGRELMRDFIDSRKGFAQWSMPTLMVTLALSLLLIYVNQTLATWAAMLPYVVIAGIAVDLFFMWNAYKKLHAARLPKEPLKGLLAYGINRSINIRRFRTPAPRVKPGDQI